MCHNIILLECDSKGDTIIKTYYPTESPLCAEAQAAGGTSHCNTRIAEKQPVPGHEACESCNEEWRRTQYELCSDSLAPIG